MIFTKQGRQGVSSSHLKKKKKKPNNFLCPKFLSFFVCNWAGKLVPEFIAFTMLKTRKECMTQVLICSNLTISIYNLQAKLW